MSYKELSLVKKFPRWHCHEFDDDFECSNNFTIKYESENLNLKPTENPLEKAVFDTRQGPFDIYMLDYVLGISRGFLISDKLKKILLEFNLSDHVIFDKIKYRIKGELRDDMSFIYFYKNFTDCIGFEKSEFWAVKRDFKRVEGEFREEDVVEKDLLITSLDHRKSLGEYYSNEKKLFIKVVKLCCPEAMKYDVFSMILTFIGAEGVYVSERLQKRLKEEKIKGIDYAMNMYFEFGCKG